MADKRCENGHFIDESWDICPYCPVESGEQDIPVVRPGRAAAPPPAEPVRSAPEPAPRPPVAMTTPMVPRRDASPQPPPMERTVAVQKIDPGAAAVTRRYVVAWLVALSGPDRGESYPVRMGRNVLGRDRRSDLVVNDEQASAHHADLVFRPEERRFILMDHNSTNGTYVNEEEIEPRRDLLFRDVVRIGSHQFLFVPLVQDGLYWDYEGALK